MASNKMLNGQFIFAKKMFINIQDDYLKAFQFVTLYANNFDKQYVFPY